MKFREIKTAIETILDNAASGRFRVIGYQNQGISADSVLDSNRSIQVYYKSGNFPKSNGSLNGPVSHHMTFAIDLDVSKYTEGDLSVMNDPSSTPAQLITALNGFKKSARLADDSFDELAEIVYQILMDATNIDFGITSYYISDRWIGSIDKDPPIDRGEFVLISGSMEITCKIDEQLEGDPGIAAVSPIFDIETDLQNELGDSDEGKSGVLTGG